MAYVLALKGSVLLISDPSRYETDMLKALSLVIALVFGDIIMDCSVHVVIEVVRGFMVYRRTTKQTVCFVRNLEFQLFQVARG